MIRFIILSCLFLLPQGGLAAGFDRFDWATLLQDHVREIDGGRATQVDYAGFSEKTALLEKYLQKLSAVEKNEFDVWSHEDQLAFLINSYNSWKKDFQKGWQGVSSLEQFFADHAEDLGLSPQEVQFVRDGKIKITFLDYDWRLNRVP